MPQLILFNKPYGVLCQFSPSDGRATLKDYIPLPSFYPAGRLDRDSEGLLILTDDGPLQHQISHPEQKFAKTYWAQVEGIPGQAALSALRKRIDLGEFVTQPASARLIDDPSGLWPRNPPIRHRHHIPTAWVEIILNEGKNRQVRRMTAAVGHPTLRLIRWQIGGWTLDNLAPGQWQQITIPSETLATVSTGRRARR